jgi:hypothetical protein
VGVEKHIKHGNFISCNDNYKTCVRAMLSVFLYDISIRDVLHIVLCPTSDNATCWALLVIYFMILTKNNPVVHFQVYRYCFSV